MKSNSFGILIDNKKGVNKLYLVISNVLSLFLLVKKTRNMEYDFKTTITSVVGLFVGIFQRFFLLKR